MSAPSPSVSEAVTLSTLKELVSRISDEMIRIYPMMNGSPTMTAKYNQLALLKYNLGEMTNEVEAGRKSIQDVGIRSEDADAFLAALDSGASQLPSLMEPEGAADYITTPENGSSTTSSGIPDIFVSMQGEQLQSMFHYLQNIRWKIEVENNPTMGFQTGILDRFEKLEKRIMSYITTETPIPDDIKVLFMKELSLLSSMLQGETDSTLYASAPSSYIPRWCGSYTRSDNDSTTGNGNSCTYNSVSNSSENQQGDWSRCFFDGTPQTSRDVQTRPGFAMTDQQIHNRGSAAAFNNGVVGGAEYKKQAQDLCRQVKNANLGDPANFGCIANPNEVSDSYSWRGNYQMVCNRIGDTWGSWYPEMFGCPSYDPTSRYKGSSL
jgi:hypothetical protein